MKQKTLILAATGALLTYLTACKSNSQRDNNTSQHTTEQNDSPAPQKEDTLSISAGSNGVSVKSGKADIDVNEKGTEVKTKDVKVKLGDGDKK